ncbi:MAG: hypothetical protein NVS4B5_14750 [Vulcanimicrobiaceae bacterium]
MNEPEHTKPTDNDAETDLHDLSDADPDFNVDPNSEEIEKIEDERH